MSALDLQTLLKTEVSALQGRVETAADLAEMIRRDQLPQAPATAFVVPLGLDSRDQGEAGANAFQQMIDDVYGIVLVVRASGDATGGRSLPKIDDLVWSIVLSVCGRSDDDAIGVYRFRRGRLIDMKAGTLFYQLDFAIQRMIEVTA